jgi:hypothetical protein
MQAGGHDFEQVVQFGLNTLSSGEPDGRLRDAIVDIPPGLVGDPTATPECQFADLTADTCAPEAQVGVLILGAWLIPFNFPNVSNPIAVFRLPTAPGDAVTFGFNINGIVTAIHATVRSAGDYGVRNTVKGVSEFLPPFSTSVTLWGVPADPVHNTLRICQPHVDPTGEDCPSRAPLKALLTMGANCSAAPATTTLSVDSWEAENQFLAYQDTAPSALTGCEKLSFDPSFSMQPVRTTSGTPSGYLFNLHVPQSLNPHGLGTPPLKRAVVTFPEGLRISASAAAGLVGCSDAQIGLHVEGASQCPQASKIGTVKITTPVLPDPLEGSVYQGTQTPHRLLRLFIEAEGDGVRVKLPGDINVDAKTGQVTTVFDNTPQLPFSDLELALKGGPRAPLSNPAHCGTYTSTSQFTPWSAPFTPVAMPSSSFDVSADGNGAPCPPPQFSPEFMAGTISPAAGAFSSFDLQLQRTDFDEEFGSLASLSLPPGLLANVRSVTVRCTEAQADAHACPAESHIGSVNVGAGAGPDPFYAGGDVYLTGPYKGNPFGVAVIVHALAGPFDLGYVVVKGAIQIHDDGSVTVLTDPFPTILQGIPLQIRDIRVNLDRPGFMFNPTSCNPMSINGTVQSTANQQASVSSRFQVGECASLAFKPKFSASTAGKTSKANGASFHVHLASSEGPHNPSGAGESNIAKVDVQLPVALPARLTTLQKACTAAQFASNPAGCPAASFVGSATAHTPILASPLSGPAILVSHGGQAFPDLVLVLQGEGVRLNLTGHTQIKKGITFSHFETVPDAPVASFDLTLPQGPHSALTTDVPGRNFCTNTRTVTVTKRITRRVNGHNRKVTVKAKKAVAAALLMPTTLTAQNGAVIHQNTKIAVTGCAKAKSKAKKKAKAKKGAKRG